MEAITSCNLWLSNYSSNARPEDPPAPPLSWSASSKASSDSPATSKHPSPLAKWVATGQDLPANLSILSPAALDMDCAHSKYPTSSSVSSSGAPSEYDEDEVVQPPNFETVAPGLYRSSFPRPMHFAFLRSLGLKTVVAFTPDEYPEGNKEFFEEEGIAFVQIGMPGNKEETIRVEPESIELALKVVLDPQNYPLLMHCNKGRHRTGCVVGCLRKLQNWPMEQILEEYKQYSQPKSRPMDQQCIRQFSVQKVWDHIKSRPRPIWLTESHQASLYEDRGTIVLRQEASTSTVCLPSERGQEADVAARAI